MKKAAILISFLLFSSVVIVAQKKADTSGGSRIAWDYSSMQMIAHKGGYPRLLRLNDSSIIVIYETRTGSIMYKRSYDEGITWSAPTELFTQFVYSGLDGKSTLVNMANPEIKQLQNGDLIVGCNYRPSKEEIAPYSIVVRRSKDNGQTWLPPQLLYSAAPRFRDGCWEPSFLQLPEGELQVYFANENPYQNSDEQEISMLTSNDNGVTWTDEPKTVSFRKDRRDGMPVAEIIGDEVVVVIEDNYVKTFKPYTVRTKLSDNWSETVLGDSENRDYALARQVDDSIYMGAPYILKLPSGETLISYQSNENRSANWEYSTMEVAVGDRTARNFIYRTQPFDVPLHKEAKWNSLALWDERTVVAVTSSDFKTDEVAPWIIKGYIIPELKVKEREIADFPVFIGAKGATSLRMGMGIDDKNIYLKARKKDLNQYSSDGVCLFFATKGNVYKIWSDDSGNVTVYRKKKGIWEEIPPKGLTVEARLVEGGSELAFVIPQQILSGFNKKNIRFTAALSASDGQSEYIEFLANTDEYSIDTWLKVEFIK